MTATTTFKNFGPINPVVIIATITLAWIALMVCAVWVRPLMPVIETRYASVAWEMWLSHNYLVPLQNGIPYADKPPLLFWLILSGWNLFGVNEWWPRLLPPLFGYLNAWMLYLLAKQLWPQQFRIHLSCWLLLLGTLAWCIYANLLLFDIILGFFVLLALYGLFKATLHNTNYGWIYFILGIGLGILTKGPVILVFILIPALLQLWIFPQNKSRWRAATPMIIACTIGILIALCWAIPAAISGGTKYAHAIFVSQSIGRMIDHSYIISNTHARPFWWYLVLLPFYFAPWIIFPPLWQALYRSRPLWTDQPLRLLVLSSILILIFLSLVNGKQIHYLLPIIPFGILIINYLLAQHDQTSPRALWPFAGITILIGLVLCLTPLFLDQASIAYFLGHLPKMAGYIFIAYGLLLLLIRPQNMPVAKYGLSLATIILVILINVFVISGFANFYRLQPIAQFIYQIQTQGYPVAITTRYNNEYQFLSRLPQPLQVIKYHNILLWSEQHSQGWILMSGKQMRKCHLKPYKTFKYESKKISFISAKKVKDSYLSPQSS